MTFMEMLEKRESCRAFSGRPVTRDDLMKLVEAGRLSPSGCNAQPWKFIVVDAPDAKEKLCDALVVDGSATGAPFRKQVPAFVILVEQPAKVMPFVKQDRDADRSERGGDDHQYPGTWLHQGQAGTQRRCAACAGR